MSLASKTPIRVSWSAAGCPLFQVSNPQLFQVSRVIQFPLTLPERQAISRLPRLEGQSGRGFSLITRKRKRPQLEGKLRPLWALLKRAGSQHDFGLRQTAHL